jgi:hypothetical protein
MTLVDTLAFPPATMTATEILRQLPNTLCEEREQAICEFFEAGQCPMWLRQWVEIPVAADGLSGAFYVMPDFLCLGTDDDYVYTPLGAINAERALRRFKAVLPTQRMVSLVYAMSKKQVAQPWGPPYDNSMKLTERWAVQTRKAAKGIKASGAHNGDLVEGHFKNVIVSPRTVTSHGTDLSFFGWYDGRGRPIQGDSGAHGSSYCDYSHGVRAVLSNVVVGDRMTSLPEALADEHAYKLFSEVRLEVSSYAQARDAYARSHGSPPGLKY